MQKFISKKIKEKSASRLAFVQATYMIDFGEINVDEVVKSFVDGKVGHFTLSESEEVIELSDFDKEYFANITRDMHLKKQDVENSLKGFLKENVELDKLDGIMRSILLCACYELAFSSDIDSKILIQEYMDVAYGFYLKNEPKVINAILDQVAKAVR
ncbi:MAG: transcription antitermination factor NusB [Alphaproteobacteria bacterium]